MDVKNLHALGVPLWEIARMASANSAKAADLVLLDSQMEILSVYVNGQLQ